MTTVSSQDARRPGAAAAGRILEVARRLRLWRVAAAVAAVVLATSLFAAVPGSLEVVQYVPGTGPGIHPSTSVPAWAGVCLHRYPSLGEPILGFCGRVDGRVIASISKSSGETHLLVTGGLHVSLVELKPGTPVPTLGSRITAVGPISTEGGLRELQAIRVGSA